MEWDSKKIRKNSWNTAFRKGRRSWFTLTVVGFLYAFAGVSNASQTAFLDVFDTVTGSGTTFVPGNNEILREYITSSPIVRDIPFITSDIAITALDALTERASWVLKLLAANNAYIERNPGEVIANMILASVLSLLIRYLLQNATIIGRDRYVLENRFSKEVPLRRLFAPFHLDTIRNIVVVMLCYHLSLLLWGVTIFGGVYKTYEYSMVPYLLAENPKITWREAKKLSREMTEGYKWKMCKVQLSCLPILLLKIVPVVGLLVSLPLEMQLNAEFYVTLRSNPSLDRCLFTEEAFSYAPYTEIGEAQSFILEDPMLSRLHHQRIRLGYSVTDYIIMFFVFSMMGWIWECGLTFFQDQILVNRGTMYGPWIPIYGFGGTGIVLFLNRFKEDKMKVFLLGMTLCAFIEYAASFLLDFLFNSSYWDYKQMFLNLNGRICFAGLIAFGICGMGGVYVFAPFISSVLAKLKKRTVVLISAVLCSLFLCDLVCCFIFGFNSGVGVGGTV